MDGNPADGDITRFRISGPPVPIGQTNQVSPGDSYFVRAAENRARTGGADIRLEDGKNYIGGLGKFSSFTPWELAMSPPSTPIDSNMSGAKTNRDIEQRVVVESNNDFQQKPDENTREAWLTISGSCLVYFACFGYMNSYGFFQDYYGENYLVGYSPSLIALIGSLQLGLMYIVGPMTGVLFDAYGLKWLYLAGAIGAVVSCLGLSFTQPGQIWQQFLSQGVLFGLTVACGTQVALSVTGQYFKEKRAIAMGIVAGGSSVGGLTLPIMFSHLVPRIGFHWTIRIMALIFIFCYGMAMLISKPNRSSQPLKSPREILDFRGFRDVRYCAMALALVIGNLGVYIPYNFIGKSIALYEPFLKLHHPDAAVNNYLLSMINASSFFGRVTGGFIANWMGSLNLLYPATSICGVICLTMWLLSSNVGVIIAFVCIYGYCSGIFISIIPSAVGRISPDENIGARLGAFFSLGAIGVFTGTPLGGALLRHGTDEEYRHLIIFTGVTMLTSGAVFFVARILCDRNLSSKW